MTINSTEKQDVNVFRKDRMVVSNKCELTRGTFVGTHAKVRSNALEDIVRMVV